MRANLLNEIYQGRNMSLAKMDLTDWPEIQALESCPQDPEWHAEGNVLIHTDMVLAECAAIEKELAPEELGTFRLSCLLHDIEKPKVTTYNEEIKHTIAPGHERMGGVVSRYLLHEMNISHQERRLVSQLVATHHLVKRAVQNIDKEDGKAFLDRLAARVNTKLLWALELADMRGRTSSDRANQIEIVQLFKMICEERDVFGKPPAPWITREDVADMPWDEHPADDLAQIYAVSEAHRRRLLGTIKDPYAAKAFIWDYCKRKDIPAQAIIMVGPSGSGKSVYVEHLRQRDWAVVSTDAVRKELYGNEDTVGDGEVFQICNERLKQSLRNGGRVVYDATNTVPDFRAKVVDMCHDYGAWVCLSVFDLSKETLKRNNKQRTRQVPESVIDKQCSKFEWPLPEEAHRVRIFDEGYKVRW